MELTAEFLDITPFTSAGRLPQRALPRGPDDEWCVCVEPYGAENAETSWATVKAGDLVRLPLIPYRTVSADLAGLVLSVAGLLGNYMQMAKQAKRVHLVVGTPVEDLRPETDCFRFWFGFAVQK